MADTNPRSIRLSALRGEKKKEEEIIKPKLLLVFLNNILKLPQTYFLK